MRVQQTDVTAVAADEATAAARAIAFVLDNRHSLLRDKIVCCRTKRLSTQATGDRVGQSFASVADRRMTSAF